MRISDEIAGFVDRMRTGIHFNGSDYVPPRDDPRLSRQVFRIFVTMLRARARGDWLTLGEISKFTNDPEASVSAQLRHLRKPRFGGYLVEKRHRGKESSGLYEYRLTPPADPQEPVQGELLPIPVFLR